MNLSTDREISCRITKTLLMYVREANNGSLGHLLDGLDLDEEYLSDTNNWVSHSFLQVLYDRMIDILDDENSVYKMALASERFHSFGLLDRIGRLLGNPKLIYSQTPRYNRLLKLIGDIYIHEQGDLWVLIEDRYHDSAQKTHHDCDYTRGILAGIPTAFNLPMAHVEEIECQVAPETHEKRIWTDKPKQGCSGCLYRVNWNARGKTRFLSRLFSRRSTYKQAIEDLLEANQRIQEKYEETKKLAADVEAANKKLIESKRQLESSTADLKASEQRYRLLAENIKDIIWIVNLDTLRFTYVSPSVESIRGFTPEEAMELGLEKTLSPDSLENITKALAEELSREGDVNADSERSRTMEVQHSCKDGSYAWAEATMTFIRNEEGLPVEILGVSRDIAERKRAEKEAVELSAQLQRAQKMEAIGSLAAGVAHDLNNILSGIVSYPELLLLDLPEDSPLRKTVALIQESGQKAAAIVQDLLTLARRGVSGDEVIDLNSFVSQYLTSLEYDRLKENHPKIRFKINLSNDLLNVKGSKVHLSKTIMNLMSNAAEAMPSGGLVTLTTGNTYLDSQKNAYELIPEGEYVVFTLIDEGIGISSEDLKRIFEPFYTKKSMGVSGTGLGMTVIWATVKDYGGYLDMSSQEGVGTRFDIYLPATREKMAELPGRVVLEDYLGSERILVVDDIKEQRDIATRMLSKLGYDVMSVASGEEAVDFIRTNSVDLLVLDMVMDPGIDGLETYRRITAKNPGQKAVIASGFSESGRVKTLQKLGAGAYIQKPYSLEKIGLAVRKKLDRR
jgi:two-component system, cell cycle sensor histidine kinase and response regulator CckA